MENIVNGWKSKSPHWRKLDPADVDKLREEAVRGPFVLMFLHAEWYLQNMRDTFNMDAATFQEVLELSTRWENIREALGKDLTATKLVKWFYAAFFSRISGQEIPEMPGGHEAGLRPHLFLALLGGGRILRFSRSLLSRLSNWMGNGSRAQRLRALSAASTIANFKKGSPSPEPVEVVATRLKHESSICSRKFLPTRVGKQSERYKKGGNLEMRIKKDPVEEWAKYEAGENVLTGPFSVPLQLETLKTEISSVVSQVFGGKRYKHSNVFPSMNGCYTESRKMCGPARVIRDFLGEELYDEWYMTFFPRFGVLIVHVPRPRSVAFGDFLHSRPFDMRCKPSFILEPLKVRTVTAGPALEYFAATFLQKFLWRKLKRFPTFQLIGEPVTAQLLTEHMLPRAVDLEEGPRNWVSGDYSAATDNLRSDLSRHCMNEICYLYGYRTPYDASRRRL